VSREIVRDVLSLTHGSNGLLTEAGVVVRVLNQTLELGRPNSVRIA
jgi:hypothetical protein